MISLRTAVLIQRSMRYRFFSGHIVITLPKYLIYEKYRTNKPLQLLPGLSFKVKYIVVLKHNIPKSQTFVKPNNAGASHFFLRRRQVHINDARNVIYIDRERERGMNENTHAVKNSPISHFSLGIEL